MHGKGAIGTGCRAPSDNSAPLGVRGWGPHTPHTPWTTTSFKWLGQFFLRAVGQSKNFFGASTNSSTTFFLGGGGGAVPTHPPPARPSRALWWCMRGRGQWHAAPEVAHPKYWAPLQGAAEGQGGLGTKDPVRQSGSRRMGKSRRRVRGSAEKRCRDRMGERVTDGVAGSTNSGWQLIAQAEP